MTETKTFKIQPDEVDWPHRPSGRSIYIGTAHPDGGSRYSFDEWDMTITFTKKVRPIQVGDIVTADACGTWSKCVVLGLNGSWAWITDDPEDEGWVTDMGNLKHAV